MKRSYQYLVLMLAVVMFSCKKPQAFEYRDIKNIKVSNWSFDKSMVSLDLVYFNPNHYGVTLKKVDCDIFLDSSFAGKYMLDTTMRIPKDALFTLPVSMEVDMKTVFKNSLQLLMNNQVLIGARGTTRVGKGGFYVTIPFNYEGRHQLNLF